MKIHLQREIDGLKKKLFHLSSLIEENLKTAFRSIEEVDSDLAASVMRADKEVDRLEVDVEEECLKILALHQPVAVDLRYIIAVLKMNNDLERIGDLAVNIAQAVSCMDTEVLTPLWREKLFDLGDKARGMLRQSLESLMELNVTGARAVMEADDEVDEAYREFVSAMIDELKNHPDRARKIVCWTQVAKNIERVADLATNIAEDTVYTVNGEIIRHGR